MLVWVGLDNTYLCGIIPVGYVYEVLQPGKRIRSFKKNGSCRCAGQKANWKNTFVGRGHDDRS